MPFDVLFDYYHMLKYLGQNIVVVIHMFSYVGVQSSKGYNKNIVQLALYVILIDFACLFDSNYTKNHVLFKEIMEYM